MNKYELLYIIDNDVTEEAKATVIEKVNEVITSGGGEVEKVDKWGTKRYAYPINFKNEGYYVLVEFSAPANIPEEIKRVIRISDETVRCMIIRK